MKPVRSLQKYIYISISLPYVKICIYKDIRDREWSFLLFSYFGLVNCMDKKCHDIVYMKLWPNMDLRLWTCTILTDFGVCYHIPVTFLLAMNRAHTTHWNWLKKHDCVPDLPVLVQIQMLACCFMSPLITSELLFLLSSQGGYTMAYCQKEISWWKAHNWSIILRELQSQLQISSFQYCGLLWPPWLKYQGVELIAAAGFPGAALGSEDAGRGPVQHPVPSLMWPSRKEVYKCEHPERQTFFFF